MSKGYKKIKHFTKSREQNTTKENMKRVNNFLNL